MDLANIDELLDLRGAEHAELPATLLGFVPDGQIDERDLAVLELPDALWDEG